MTSDIKYARSGDVHIAYRVFGEGPRDLVLIPGTLSHAELYWEFPINQYLLRRLLAFARVIVFDKRGQGLSDRVAEQTLEERIGDVHAVMDAAGSARAAIVGWSEGGPMSLMFSATYPERTSTLVVCGGFASIKAEPWGVSEEQLTQFLRRIEVDWGKGVLVGEPGGNLGADESQLRDRRPPRLAGNSSTDVDSSSPRRPDRACRGWPLPCAAYPRGQIRGASGR